MSLYSFKLEFLLTPSHKCLSMTKSISFQLWHHGRQCWHLVDKIIIAKKFHVQGERIVYAIGGKIWVRAYYVVDKIYVKRVACVKTNTLGLIM